MAWKERGGLDLLPSLDSIINDPQNLLQSADEDRGKKKGQSTNWMVKIKWWKQHGKLLFYVYFMIIKE